MNAVTVSLSRARFDDLLASEWDAIVREDPEATFFQSRLFLDPIALGENGPSCRFLLAREGARLVGAMPLRFTAVWDRRREMYRTDVSMMGSLAWADYTGPVVDVAAAPAALAAMGQALADHPWARLRLKNLSMSAARQEIFLKPFTRRRFSLREEVRVINDGETDNLKALSVPLPSDFDSYLASLSRNTRQKLRRLLRQLDAGEFEIRHGTTREDIDALATLWKKQWQDKSGVNGKAEIYARILSDAQSQGRLALSMLHRDGELLGAIASFEDREAAAMRFFVSGRDPDVRDLPVGLILHADAIRRAIGMKFRDYDMLRGDEPYKLQLGAQIRDLRYPIFRRRSAEGDGMRFSPETVPLLLAELPGLLESERQDRAMVAAHQCANALDL